MRVFPEPVARETADSLPAAWRVQSGTENLVQVHQRMDALFLSNNFCSQCGLEIDRVRAALVRSSARVSASSRLRMDIELSFMTAS